MAKILWFNFFLLSTFQNYAQSWSSLYLIKTIAEISERPYDQILRNSQNYSIRSPLFNEFQFRTNTDKFRLDEQEYTFRFNISGLNKSKNIRQFSNSLTDLYKTESEILHYEVMYDTYKDIIDQYYTLLYLNKLDSVVLLLKDEVAFIKNQVEAGNTQLLDNYVDAVDILQEFTFKKQEYINQSSLSSTKITTLKLEKPSKLSFSNFISLEQIYFDLSKLDVGNSLLNHPSFRLDKIKNERNKLKYNLDRSEDNKWIDFYQIEFDNSPDDILKEKLNVGVGIRIPYSRSDSYKLKTTNIENKLDELKIVFNASYTSEEITLKIQQWNQNYKEYMGMQDDLQTKQIDLQAIQTLAHTEKAVLTYLKAILNQEKSRLQVLDVELNLYKKYLEILFSLGKLTELPMINYLSSDRERLFD